MGGPLMKDAHGCQIETWLYAYPVWKRRLQNLHAQLDGFPGGGRRFLAVPSFAHGSVRDTTYEAVEKRMELEEKQLHPLEFKVKLLETALLALTEEEMTLVKLKYFAQKNNTLIWETLFVSRRAFFRKRAHVLNKLFEALGGEGALIWSEDSVEAGRGEQVHSVVPSGSVWD